MPVKAPPIYLELGAKRVFAGAVEWPGWCRSGKGEEGAVELLIAYAPRYAAVVNELVPAFAFSQRASSLPVAERLKGDATTDFGAPNIAPSADSRPLSGKDLNRHTSILEACWSELDRAADAAAGLELAKGPRGGGRDLPGIVGHVVSAEAGYLRRLAATPPRFTDPVAAKEEVREAALGAVSRAATEGLPEAGPRGGRLWTPRYFVRRAAWHVLDHAWEIQDRAPSKRGHARQA